MRIPDVTPQCPPPAGEPAPAAPLFGAAASAPPEAPAPVYDRYEPEAGGEPEAAPSPASPAREEAERCTTDTGAVDREIEALKRERERLEQQLSAAGPREAERLARQLAQVQRELRQKDNDGYRRRRAVVS